MYKYVAISNAIFHIIEINECQVDNGHCYHRCINTAGSYYCECKAGYQLQPDKHRCTGNIYIYLNS